MLSIIVCSMSSENLARLQENIKQTSAIGHEVVVYHNHDQKGLCEVYNLCALKARYSNLCFIHEDILFHTKDWDKLVVQYLNDSQTGLLGVMGGRYKSAFGLGWRDGDANSYRFNVKDGVEAGKHIRHYPENENLSQVVCLDGAFLCCRKEIWEKFRFDETHFKGFHFYDIDFTFRVAQQYRNYTINGLLLEHFSQGRINEKFLEDSISFDTIHRHNLPFTIENLSKKEINQLEGYALSKKLMLLKKYGFSYGIRIGLLYKYIRCHFNFYQILRNVYFGFVKS